MGHDKDQRLSIVSFNSSRRAVESLPQNGRQSYLEQVINGAKPDVCFLPGDDKTLKCNAVRGYEQFTVPTADGTVLLYDHSRVSMKTAPVNVNSFGPLAGLDLNKMVFPEVEVRAPAPFNDIVKDFCMVSWKHTLWTDLTYRVKPEKLAESIILFSQRVAMESGRPLLISGEMTIDYSTLMEILKRLSNDADQFYLSGAIPEMSQFSMLPSMTRSVTKSERDIFRMNVIQCRQEQIVTTWSSGPPVADCFIASKALKLSEAKLLNLEEVTGRTITMEPVKTYAPTRTQMEIPVRPPRHHGG